MHTCVHVFLCVRAIDVCIHTRACVHVHMCLCVCDCVFAKLCLTDTVMKSSFSYRCSVLGILHWYNVVIPQVVIDLLKGTVTDFEKCLLHTIPFVETEEGNMEFHNLRMKDLRILNDTLHQFFTDAYLIDFLVHFSMHDSRMFSQYLWERLLLQQPPASKVPAVHARELVTSTVFAGLEDVISTDQDSTEDSDDGTMQVSTVFLILYQKFEVLSRMYVLALA